MIHFGYPLRGLFIPPYFTLETPNVRCVFGADHNNRHVWVLQLKRREFIIETVSGGHTNQKSTRSLMNEYVYGVYGGRRRFSEIIIPRDVTGLATNVWITLYIATAIGDAHPGTVNCDVSTVVVPAPSEARTRETQRKSETSRLILSDYTTRSRGRATGQ